MNRTIKWTENAASNLENLIKDIKNINPKLAHRTTTDIFDKINLLESFPAVGRIPKNYTNAQKKVKNLIDIESLPQTDLELRELIIKDYLILYGFN